MPVFMSVRASRIVPLVIAFALFMENLDSTIISTSIPAMAADFGVSPVRLNIAITAYLLAMAVLIPASGWLADRFGARRVSVIETFGVEKPRQTISEVSAASGLDRATARRCLLTLAHLGYADYDGKFFTLNPRVLRLGTACLAAMPLPHLVQPWLDQLSEELEESTSVSILDETEIVYVARAAQKKVMSVSLMPGSRLPAYCTSMGRVLLAALPEAEARARLERAPLPARTAHTLTDPAAIMAELAKVRAQGYAVIDQEVELGLRSLAVPLRDSRSRIVAALNLGLPVRDETMAAILARFLPNLLVLQSELKKVLL